MEIIQQVNNPATEKPQVMITILIATFNMNLNMRNSRNNLPRKLAAIMFLYFKSPAVADFQTPDVCHPAGLPLLPHLVLQPGCHLPSLGCCSGTWRQLSKSRNEIKSLRPDKCSRQQTTVSQHNHSKLTLPDLLANGAGLMKGPAGCKCLHQ